MKKLVIFLLALTLFFVAGCTKRSGGGEDPDEWGITLSVEDVTLTGMTLVCTQSGGNYTGELHTGTPYALEQLVDGEWIAIPNVQGILDWAWTTVALLITREGETRWDVNWEFLYGSLDPGSYRISKEITDFRGPGDYTNKTYYAEFAIVD